MQIFLLEFSQIPKVGSGQIYQHDFLLRAALFCASEYLYNEEIFIDNVIECIWGEDVVNADVLPDFYVNQELFQIDLLLFYHAYKQYIFNLLGGLPHKIMMDDSHPFLLKMEPIWPA